MTEFYKHAILFVCLMVFNATFNDISVIPWRSVLLVGETGGPGENHRPVASHWQTLSHNVVYLALIVIWTHNISILRGNWTSPQRKATRIKAPQTKVTRIKAPLTKTPQKYKLIFFVSYRYFFCVFVCKIFFVFYNLIQNLS